MHFLTGVCAIIGGVFTGKYLLAKSADYTQNFIAKFTIFFYFPVAGLIDAFIYHSARAIQKKIDLGKASQYLWNLAFCDINFVIYKSSQLATPNLHKDIKIDGYFAMKIMSLYCNSQSWDLTL